MPEWYESEGFRIFVTAPLTIVFTTMLRIYKPNWEFGTSTSLGFACALVVYAAVRGIVKSDKEPTLAAQQFSLPITEIASVAWNRASGGEKRFKLGSKATGSGFRVTATLEANAASTLSARLKDLGLKVTTELK